MLAAIKGSKILPGGVGYVEGPFRRQAQCE